MNADHTIDSGRPDLVPMIDCIMLLLLFFMMTTRFTAEERTLAAVLPTGHGIGCPGRVPEPPPVIHLSAVPAGISADAGHASLELAAQAPVRDVDLRLGNREPLRIAVASLATPAGIERVHAWVRDGLTAYEQPGVGRQGQHEVDIACFSGLPWAVALVAYDAVRGYEVALAPADQPALALQRPVDFAPPTLRDHDIDARAEELSGLLRLR